MWGWLVLIVLLEPCVAGESTPEESNGRGRDIASKFSSLEKDLLVWVGDFDLGEMGGHRHLDELEEEDFGSSSSTPGQSKAKSKETKPTQVKDPHVYLLATRVLTRSRMRSSTACRKP